MDALVNAVESTENVVDASHFYNGEGEEVIVDSTELSEAETPNQPNPTTYEPSSRNGILIEFQNTMSVPAYENVNTKTMKMEELCTKVHEQLFSTSTRKGFAEKLMSGEGQFKHLFERVPIETHLFTAIFRFFYRPH